MILFQRFNYLKANDDDWIYYSDFKSSILEDEIIIHELTRIFWISLDQYEMGKCYDDILQVNVSENRNIYYFYFIIFILMNEENKSWNLVYYIYNW